MAKKGKLANISDYSDYHGIHRSTTHELINDGKITRYTIHKVTGKNKSQEEDDKPLLNLDEKPPVQKYAGKRDRRISS